jgi:transcription antitermination factor NusG
MKSYCAEASTFQHPWYGLRTRSNQEKLASTILRNKGYQEYLPLYQSRRRWSDRIVETTLPLFPGYVFCRFDPKLRRPIITTPGVVAVIGFGNEPAPIDDKEIEAIQTVLLSRLAAEPCPFVREGQKVRVYHGPLKGLEGILVKKKSELRIILSISLLQRSISAELDGESVTTD